MATRLEIFSAAFASLTGDGFTQEDLDPDLGNPSLDIIGQRYPTVLAAALARQQWPFTLIRQPLTARVFEREPVDDPEAEDARRQNVQRQVARFGGVYLPETDDWRIDPFRYLHLYRLPPKANVRRGAGLPGLDALMVDEPNAMPPLLGQGVVSVHEGLSWERDADSVPFEELRNRYLNTVATEPFIVYQTFVPEEDYPDAFTEYLILKVAESIAYPITRDRGVKRDIGAEAEAVLQVAIDDASAVGPPERLFGSNPWTTAARGWAVRGVSSGAFT